MIRFRKKNRLRKHTHDAEKRSVVFRDSSAKTVTKRVILRSRKRNFIKKIINFKTVILALISILLLINFFNIVKYKNNPVSATLINPVAGVNSDPAALDEIKAKLQSELAKRSVVYEKIISFNNYYIIILSGKKEVYITPNKDLAEQITSLQFILNRLTMEGRSFRKLDLRFTKPVISL